MAVAALVFAVRLAGRDRAVAVLLSLLAVVVALAYSWLFEIPTAYFRMAYYLPLALVPLVALALVRLLEPPPRRARRRARGGGDRCLRLGAGLERARLLRVHERCLAPRPRRRERRPAARTRWW